MATMTAQLPLMLVPAGAVQIGEISALVEDETGGRVFIRGELVFAWNAGDELGRRLAAVQLVAIKGARAVRVAEGFGINAETLRRWDHAVANDGIAALVPGRRGPKGPSVLSPAVVADIRARRRGGASLRAIATAVGVSEATVRRALPTTKPAPEQDYTTSTDDAGSDHDARGDHGDDGDDRGTSAADEDAEDDLPLLPPPADRDAERAAARWGKLPHAEAVFTPAARVPLAGLLLAIPALQATGLLSCATQVFGCLPNGFYGLDTMLVEESYGPWLASPAPKARPGSTRTRWAGCWGWTGARRSRPSAKITILAATGRAEELLAAMAAAHVTRLDQTNPDLLAVFYVDGHVRAYQGGAKIAKTHLSRLKFPAPATVETWVSDASGDPVLVVMAEPGASLAMELRRLLPGLRRAVGDDRRVLVGFDRGGWSPKLFAHMDAAGFDVLTWRKGVAQDIDPDLFTDLTYTDETGRTHTWRVADTTVDLPTNDAGEVFTMRQVSLTVPGTKTGREALGQDATRQIHILTTRTDLPAEQVIYRMGSRWRQENYFRYARMHFDLDSHDAYATTDDDPTRMVPNPAKKKAHKQVLAARARYDRALASTDAALLEAKSPPPG